MQLKTNWLAPGGHQHALLHHAEFDFKNLRQMLIPQRLEYHSLVDAVHELRRELAASRFHGRALNLVVEIVVDFHCLRREPKTAIHQIRHLAGAQVRGQNDDALRKIDAAIIAERERGLVQNARAAVARASLTPSRFRQTAGSRASVSP